MSSQPHSPSLTAKVNDEQKYNSHPKLSLQPVLSTETPFKLHIGVDFGTDGLGIAYAYNGKIYIHSKYESKRFGSTAKPKIITLIDNNSNEAVSLGMDARYTYMVVGEKCTNLLLFDRFKMSLYEHDYDNSLDIKNDLDEKYDEQEDKENTNSTSGLLNKLSTRYNNFINEHIISERFSSEQTLMEGWLQKRSRHLKQWRRRFARIENKRYLYTYENQYTHEYTYKIDLRVAVVEYLTDKPTQFKLYECSLETNKITATWFECATVEDATTWIDCIRQLFEPTPSNPTDDPQDEKLQLDGKYKQVNIREQLKAANGMNYNAEYVFVAVLKHVKCITNEYITDKKRRWNVSPHEIQWIVTVPAIWNDDAKNKMKQWISKAGLVDPNIDKQCLVVYEPDCAALAIQHEIHENARNKFKTGEKYILIDAGGGTVDIAVHQILGDFRVKEIFHPTGGKWGSCYIDDEYINLLNQLFGEKITQPFRNESCTIWVWMKHFFQQAKCTFFENENQLSHPCSIPVQFIRYLEEKLGSNDDPDKLFKLVANAKINGESGLVRLCEKTKQLNAVHLLQQWKLLQYMNILNTEYDDINDWQYLTQDDLINDLGFKAPHARKFVDKVKKLQSVLDDNKQDKDKYWLEIDVKLWKQMFDKVIDKIINHVKLLLTANKVSNNCIYLCLAGGLSCSKYFQLKIRKTFGFESKYKLKIFVPKSPLLTVAKGAVYFAITKNYIHSRVLKRSYGVEVMWKMSRCIEQGISMRYIEKNKHQDKENKEFYVHGCFKVLVHKNEEISTGSVIEHTVYRKDDKTMKIKVPILCSYQSNPKICTDGDVLGEVIIDFDEKDKGETAVSIVFYFGDTILKVEVFKKNRPNVTKELKLQYFSSK